MNNKESTIPSSCMIAQTAEIASSILAEDVVVADYTQVLHSKLDNSVQIGRNNSILYARMGKYCYTGPNTTIRNAKLGNFNSISWNVSIGGNTHDMNKVTTHSFLVYPKWKMGGNGNWESASEPCTLGNDIWIAAGVNILRGVTIGSGAIIGAGAVVTKSVPPYAVVVGNPGRVIKMRSSDEIIEKMLEVAWWDFPENVIRENFETFNSELTMDVVEKLLEMKARISHTK